MLWIDLDGPVTLPIPRLGSPALGPGRYAYCGSARGPGGIRARVARHLRPATSATKKAHWHVDRLTAAGSIRAVLTVPGGSECALVAALSARADDAIPIPGFGSSDCRACAAHLVSFRGTPSLEAVALTPDRASLFLPARDAPDRDH